MMGQLMRRLVLAAVVLGVVGCSGLQGSTVVPEDKKAASVTDKPRYAATIRVLPYVDERGLSNPHKIGIGAGNLMGFRGLDGNDIVLEQDASTLVTGAIRKRLEDTGYQIVEGNAMFEVSGAVKELRYDVKVRDEVAIVVETTLKEAASGKVLWSGLVTEKTDHFAGVAGDSFNDVVKYLNFELGIVTKKTGDAINGVLMSQRPDLFNLVPGTMPTPGVVVLTPPASAPAAAMPAASAVPAAMPQASATKGLLVVTTDPARAKVYVDNVYYGLSPLRLEMDPGIRNVTVKLGGYKKASEKVSIRKGDITEVELKLEQ